MLLVLVHQKDKDFKITINYKYQVQANINYNKDLNLLDAQYSQDMEVQLWMENKVLPLVLVNTILIYLFQNQIFQAKL